MKRKREMCVCVCGQGEGGDDREMKRKVNKKRWDEKLKGK